MLGVLLLLFGGAAQVVTGKYIQHSEEFLRLYPPPAIAVPNPLPQKSDELARLIVSGHATAELFEALGDALSAEGDSGLAYRAYDRAQILDPKAGPRLQPKKDRCEPIAASVLERERKEARIWVDALQSYERARIENGEDPRELAEFYERYGRAEDDLEAIIQGRQLAFWTAVLGIGLGLALVIGAKRFRRRIAAIQLAFAILCLIGAARGVVMTPYLVATGALLVGSLAVAVRGKRAA